MDKSVDTSGSGVSSGGMDLKPGIWFRLARIRSCNLVSVLSVPCRAILYVSSSATAVFCWRQSPIQSILISTSHNSKIVSQYINRLQSRTPCQNQ